MEFFKDFCREFEVQTLVLSSFLEVIKGNSLKVVKIENCIDLQEVSICTLGPDFDHDGKVDVAKYMKITFGKVSWQQ